MTEPHKIWIKQYEAAVQIEDEFGTQKSLDYLVGDKEIEFDAEEIEKMRKDDIRQCTRDLLLMERAREWLLED